jgi:hydrogenase maturation factor
VSRLYKVVRNERTWFVEVESVDGVRSRASLLALDGPIPGPGDWVVVHSGYVLERVDAEEAASIADEIRSAHERVGVAGEGAAS